MSGNWHKQGNIRGKDGVGVPAGGQTGQSLQKVGNSDFATAWDHVNYADIEGKVPKEALPDIGNSTVPVESEAAMLNLPAVVGNQAIRTDLGATFVLMELPASDIDNWLELVTTSDVQSVNGQTGNVNLTKGDVGLDKVNNTADADKPVATQSVPGLLSPGDKEKLDEATYIETPNALVQRNANGDVKFGLVNLTKAPSRSGHATPKSYVDDQVATVAGGSTVATTDWDAMRTEASTGVVEGFVKGCPVGGAVTGTESAGFVKDPVWKLEVRPEGLGYVTQRAQLLSCVPVYMVGFAWERIYNPAEAKWGAWTCVAGDTGPIESVKSTSSTATPYQPLIHQDNSKTKLYLADVPYLIRRKGGVVSLSGAAGSLDANMTYGAGGSPVSLGYMVLAANSATTTPGSDYTLHWWHLGDYEFDSVQQGSGPDRWFMRRGGPVSADFTAERYSGNMNSRKWLPFSKMYPAPPVNTYTGPGFVPPVLDAETGDTGS